MSNSYENPDRLSLSQIGNISLNKKRDKKASTQSAINIDYYGKNCDLFLIESIKKKLQQKVEPGQSRIKQLKGIIELDTGTISVDRKYSKFKHKVSYKRGINAERTEYLKLAQKIKELQELTPSIGNMNAVDIFQYKQKLLNDYLVIFFKQVGQQCYEKSLFVAKLWQTLYSIFEQLIKKLLKQLNRSQKLYLSECHITHERYQQKFQQYRGELIRKNKQIEKYKEVLSKIALKNRQKCRKNKQITYGIEVIAGKLTNIERQRNQLKSQYVNMLTLGFQGGMDYKQALVYATNKFGIDKQEEELPKQSDSKQQNKKSMSQKKGKSQKKHSRNRGQSVLANKIHKIKQKYIYGSNRRQVTINQQDSDEEELKNLGINVNELQNKKKIKKLNKVQYESSQSTINYDDNFANKRVQTNPVFMICSDKLNKSCDFGNLEKYKDCLIKNAEVQTQIKVKKMPLFNKFDRSTQYENQLQELSIKRNSEQNKNLSSQIESQFKTKINNSQNKGFEQQKITGCIPQVQVFDIPEASCQKLNEDNEVNKSLTIIKKQKVQKKIQNLSLKKKKQNPSIFKRASILMASSNPQNMATKRYSRNRNSSNIPLNQVKMITGKLQNNVTEENERPSGFNYNRRFVNNKTMSSSESSISEKQSQIDCQQDYLQTNMLSFIENMSKLTPKGIFIDEAMVFLLKKSLFRIKHDSCNNVYQKNKSLIMKVRSEVSAMKNIKSQVLLTTKSVMKLLSSVYDIAFQQIAQKQIIRNKSIQSKFGASCRQKNFLNFYEKDMKADLSSCKRQINLLQLLKDCIKKQYPMYKLSQIEHKIVLLTKTVQYQSCPHYLVKNFMLLSCLEQSIFSSVVFSSDVQFYFKLLLQLNIKAKQKPRINKQDKMNQSRRRPMKMQQQFMNQDQNIENMYKSFNSCYENCFTNLGKLRDNFPVFLKKYYKKQSLYLYIEKRISRALQKLYDNQQASLSQISEKLINTRLDVFKCCQLIMQSIFSYKLDMLKSYAQISQIQEISPNGLIDEEIFMDLLGFMKMTKLQKLNTVNKFRYDFSKTSTSKGVSIINLVNFCLNHDIPDFDQILFDTIQKYHVSQQISHKIQVLHLNYKKFDKIEKICRFLHKKNSQSKNQQQIQSKSDKQIQSKSKIDSESNVLRCQMADTKAADEFGYENKTVYKVEKKQSRKMKDFWEIIGVKASKSLIHCKVVELQASELVQKILGKEIIHIYMASLCQLQQKKPVKAANLRSSCAN